MLGHLCPRCPLFQRSGGKCPRNATPFRRSWLPITLIALYPALQWPGSREFALGWKRLATPAAVLFHINAALNLNLLRKRKTVIYVHGSTQYKK